LKLRKSLFKGHHLGKVTGARFAPAYWAVTILAAAGLALLFFDNRFAAVLLASILATFSAVYAVVQNHLRYQHPVYWILLLLAAWGVGRTVGERRLRV
jgi:hypothetical protein